MSIKIKSEIELIKKALNLTPDNANYRFSTWGEFNEGYLSCLSETELKQYRRLTLKFALIHDDQKHGITQNIHNWSAEYVVELDQRLKELSERYKIE